MKKEIHVVGAVIVQSGKIFCAQRGRNKTLPGKWEFPGGKIEHGESPIEALKREIKEEMDCEIQVGKQIEHTIYEYDFGIVHLTTYYCRIVSGKPQLTEHTDSKWLVPAELNELDWAPADIPAIETIKKEMNFFIEALL